MTDLGEIRVEVTPEVREIYTHLPFIGDKVFEALEAPTFGGGAASVPTTGQIWPR